MIHLRVPFLIFCDIVLIAAAVIGTIGAWITAFSLPVNYFPLFLIISGAVIFITFAANFFRYKGVFIASLLILIPLILNFQGILSGARSVIFAFTRELNLWTYSPVLFPGSIPQNSEVTIFLIAISLILIVLLSMTISICQSTALTIAVTAPFGLFTLILLTSPPDMIYLKILIGVYIAVLVSNMLNLSGEEKQSRYLDSLEMEDSVLAQAVLGKKTAFLRKLKTFPLSVKTFYSKTKILPALLIAALLLTIAGIIAPQNSRLNLDLAGSINYHTRLLLSRLGIIPPEIGYGWLQIDGDNMFFDTNILRVADAGARVFHDINLLEISVNRSGVFYLRGFSLDEFDGRTWHRSLVSRDDVDEELSRQIPTLIAMRHSELFPYAETHPVHITIQHTGDVTENIDYIPYYSILASTIFDEDEPLLELEDVVRDIEDIYEFDFFHNPRRTIHDKKTQLSNQFEHTEQLIEYAEFLNSTGLYRGIDPSTAEILRQIAQSANININTDRLDIVNQVAEFIVSRGEYTHTPPRIPLGADFALFFLEVSRMGYCIHFATAATLMLRALDVPARFTTGYLVHISESNVGRTVILTDRNAHAWVEVFYDDIGWVPIDVTPAFAPGPDGTAIAAIFGGIYPPSDILDMDLLMLLEYDWFHYDASYSYGLFNLTSDMILSEEELARQRIVRTIWVVSTIVIFVIFAIFRIVLIRKLRRRRFADRNTNAAVIAISRYITRLTNLNDDLVPKQIRDIALKAYFSQHIISKEEQKLMLDFSAKLRSDIFGEKSKFGRFVMNYILVL